MRAIFIFTSLAFCFVAESHADKPWRPKAKIESVSIDQMMWQATGITEENVLSNDGKLISTVTKDGGDSDVDYGRFVELESIKLNESDKSWTIRFRVNKSTTSSSNNTSDDTELKEIKAKALLFPNNINLKSGNVKYSDLPTSIKHLDVALAFMGYELVELNSRETQKVKDTITDGEGNDFRLEPLSPASELLTAGEDLTEKVMREQPLPVVGRRSVLRTLFRRLRQKLPGAIGTAESGVGKTALANEIARLMVYAPEELPKALRGHRIVSVDASLIKGQDGHEFVGKMQATFNKILNEAANPKDGVPVILVFDEFHLLIGGGTSVGNPNGIEQSLKSFMEKHPHVKILGFTTNDEFAKHVAGDEALVRRFGASPVLIEQITKKQAWKAIRANARALEKEFNVTFPHKTLKRAAELSEVYFVSSRPGNTLTFLRNVATMVNDEIEYGERAENKNVIKSKDLEKNLRKESNIPLVGKKFRSAILGMEEKLKRRVFGQDHAIKEIVKAYQRRFAFQHLKKPIGSFLLAGDTGTGKTELAKALAEVVTGDEENLVRIDLGNIKNVSQIIGRPGKLGLVHNVAKQPFSIVLLDELDRTTEEVKNLFYTAADDGYMRDFNGKKIDFRHTLLLGTTNAGTTTAGKTSQEVGFVVNKDSSSQKVKEGIGHSFDKAFAARFKPIAFNAFDKTIRKQIAELVLKQTESLLWKSQHLHLKYDEKVFSWIARNATSYENGRGILKKIDESIKDVIAESVTRYTLASTKKNPGTITIHLKNDGDGLESLDFKLPEIKIDHRLAKQNKDKAKQRRKQNASKNIAANENRQRHKQNGRKKNR